MADGGAAQPARPPPPRPARVDAAPNGPSAARAPRGRHHPPRARRRWEQPGPAAHALWGEHPRAGHLKGQWPPYSVYACGLPPGVSQGGRHPLPVLPSACRGAARSRLGPHASAGPRVAWGGRRVGPGPCWGQASGRALDSLDCGRRGKLKHAGGCAVPAAFLLRAGGEGEERSSRGTPRRWSPAAGAATPGLSFRRWRLCCRRAGAGSAWVAPPPSSSAPCKGGRSSATRCGRWRGNEAGAARLPSAPCGPFPPPPSGPPPLEARPPALAVSPVTRKPQAAARRPSPQALGAPGAAAPRRVCFLRFGGGLLPSPASHNVTSVTGRLGRRRPGAGPGCSELGLGRLT